MRLAGRPRLRGRRRPPEQGREPQDPGRCRDGEGEGTDP